MYNLTIHFGPNAVAWSFLFKDKKPAETVFDAYLKNSADTSNMIIKDDYGQLAIINAAMIHGILIEDTEAGQEARILRGLDQARGQARATQRAKTDPELSRIMQAQGPGILTPFTNGGFRPQ